mmetsp:Transcript_3745/g.9244  ORF Transcript_3745/g.9244 Transcript_3745/m.9244 type:complete len:235 (-) Transcript_3745:699-1403(-)
MVLILVFHFSLAKPKSQTLTRLLSLDKRKFSGLTSRWTRAGLCWWRKTSPQAACAQIQSRSLRGLCEPTCRMKVLRSQSSSSVTTDQLLSCWNDPKNWTTLGCLNLHSFTTSCLKQLTNSPAQEEEEDFSISFTATGEPYQIASQTVPIEPRAMHRCFLTDSGSTSHNERRSTEGDELSSAPCIHLPMPSLAASATSGPTDSSGFCSFSWACPCSPSDPLILLAPVSPSTLSTL